MKTLIFFIFTSLLWSNDQIPAPPQAQPILLKNGFIHTVSDGTIEGSILFDKGKIIAVGEYLAPPDDAKVIDLNGKHVYPSFISAVSGIGLLRSMLFLLPMIILREAISIQTCVLM